MEIAAVLVLARDARDGTLGFAVDDDDTLVAGLAHRLHVRLRHHELAAVVGHHLEDRVQVPVLRVHVEDAEAAPAVRRLDDHLAAELAEELLELRHVAGEEGARDDVGEVERVELLIGVAERGRTVHPAAT